MTLEQIRGLTAEKPLAAPEKIATSTEAAPPTPLAVAGARPKVPGGVPEWFLPSGAADGGLYRPGLFSSVHLHYASAKEDVDWWESVHLWTPLEERAPDWTRGERVNAPPPTGGQPEPGAGFAELPEAATREKSFERWRKSLGGFLYRERPLVLFACEEPKALSRPSETEAAFRARLAHLARERRDEAVEKLRGELAPKLERLQEAVRRAQSRRDKESSQYGSSVMSTVVDFGMTLVGAFLGRKLGSVANARRASRTARSGARVLRERDDSLRAEEALAAEKQKLEALEAEFRSRTQDLAELGGPESFTVEERSIRPKKTDISIDVLGIAWRRE